MSNDVNAAALNEAFNNTVTPMDQVRESSAPANGWYNNTIIKLDPKLDDEGRYYIQGEFKSHAKDTPGQQPIDYNERFYIGTTTDPLAKLPETRLDSFGYKRLKGIARACDVPTIAQPDAKLCANLVNKAFTNRIEERSYKKKDGSTGTAVGFGRNPVKLGAVPARLDGTGPVNGAAGAPTSAPASAELAGAAFGAE